jgi:hypothetical protein
VPPAPRWAKRRLTSGPELPRSAARTSVAGASQRWCLRRCWRWRCTWDFGAQVRLLLHECGWRVTCMPTVIRHYGRPCTRCWASACSRAWLVCFAASRCTANNALTPRCHGVHRWGSRRRNVPADGPGRQRRGGRRRRRRRRRQHRLRGIRPQVAHRAGQGRARLAQGGQQMSRALGFPASRGQD